MYLLAQKHRLGIACAALVGVIMVLPQFVLPHALGTAYGGVQPLMLDDEDIYRARINEILDGQERIASPYLHEYKEMPVVVPPINEWLYAIPAYLFGLSSVIILSKFLLPALLFFLVYLLVLHLVAEEDIHDRVLAALSAAFLVVMGNDFVDYHHMFAILGGAVGPGAMLWERIVNPIMGAVQIFAFLLLVQMTIRGSRKAAFGGGALLALMVGYFFSFGLSLSVLGALLSIYAWYRDWSRVKSLFIVLGTAVIIDTPYWFSMFQSVGGAGGRELAARNGMFFTHASVINKALLATTIFFLFGLAYAFFAKRSKEPVHAWQFMAALVLGSWIAFNEQVLTGRAIWYHHFVQYVIPLSFVVIVVTSYYSLRKWAPRLWRAGCSLLIVVSLAYGVWTSWAGALLFTKDLVRMQTHASVFNFLKERAGTECVVLVKEDHEALARTIPAYTHCDVYSTSYVFIGVPHERVLHNFFLSMRLSGVGSDESRAYLLANESLVRHVTFDNWDRLFSHDRDQWFFDQVSYLENEYKQFVKGDLKEELLRYRMDYLVTEEPISPSLLSELSGLQLATSTGAFIIYNF